MRRFIPSVLLLLLLLAGIFRWQTIASKSLESRVLKWQRNIITGEQRLKEFTIRDGIKTTKLKQEDDYTTIYYFLLAGTTGTIIWQASKNKKAHK